jgi:hypothetical protein
MRGRLNIFRVILFVVAVIHCITLFHTSLLEVEGLDSYNIELVDLDSNESDAYNNGSCISKFLQKNHLKIVFTFFQGKVQAAILSVPFSPPELKF